ncbi:ABC transporter permease [Solitalea koreensis]|uniref:Putative ABC transport system permease protein n=1 Tax=Solitalea koreensis TaxID=543615 RepID=A0A521DD19_9SPHI|nr:ABC transporter permease [Solitalea koreensis]SMO69472.1 putative ABC transport system permease protein [Solitalea koreensis]
MIYLRLIKESFAFAFEALRVNKLRTILSLLGITIGILTIIAILTAVDALKGNVRASVDKLGTNAMFIEKWPILFGKDYPWWKFINRPLVTYADFQKLKPRLQTAEASTFFIDVSNQTVKYKNNSVEGAYMTGATYEFDQVYAFEITNGRYFTEVEAKAGRNLAIIGAAIATGLFKNEDPIGKEIKVAGAKLVVIGVIKKEGASILKFSDDDNSVIVPYNFIKGVVNVKSDRNHPHIMLKGKDGIPIDEVESEVHSVMRSIRRLSPLEEDNFAVNKITVLANQVDSLFDVLNIAGWVIGGFSILVGGFGIANIMFVSVKERTHIIGIQKSLGAKNFFILLQFLIESVALCLIGGAIGLLIVWLISVGASKALNMDFTMNMGNVITGVGISVIIGTLAGFIPAYTASQLDPVEAIRSK